MTSPKTEPTALVHRVVMRCVPKWLLDWLDSWTPPKPGGVIEIATDSTKRREFLVYASATMAALYADGIPDIQDMRPDGMRCVQKHCTPLTPGKVYKVECFYA